MSLKASAGDPDGAFSLLEADESRTMSGRMRVAEGAE
jgi:hypothetical protein